MVGVTQLDVDNLFWKIMDSPKPYCTENRTENLGGNNTVTLGTVWVDGSDGTTGCTGLDGCRDVPIDKCSSVIGCTYQQSEGTTTVAPTVTPKFPTFPPSVPSTSHLTDIETRQFDIGMVYLGWLLLVAAGLLVWTMIRRQQWCRHRRRKQHRAPQKTYDMP
jgi:hypothetical protein